MTILFILGTKIFELAILLFAVRSQNRYAIASVRNNSCKKTIGRSVVLTLLVLSFQK